LGGPEAARIRLEGRGTAPTDLASLTSAEKDALILAQAESIAALTRQVEALVVRVSDRYGGQLGWAQKDPQVCLAHLS